MVVPGNLHTDDLHQRFVRSGRAHVLMITNHGVHEWKVVPGMPDTGGQNVYVNQLTDALVAQGYRVTIANRGGYPHPKTQKMQTGVVYHSSGHARIIYLEDGTRQFVRKEDMNEQLPELVRDLARKLGQDGDAYDLILSHYWDAGKLGVMLNESGSRRAPHVWVPHSLGALKKRNMDPSTWANLRIDERIAHERELLKSIDGAVATSSAIRDTFRDDYGYDARYFLPPCVNEERYRPRSAEEVEPVWTFLEEQSGLRPDQLKGRKLVTEISRTDKTKRKDVLIKAFAQARKEIPEALLLVTIDPQAAGLHDSLLQLIADLGIKDDVIVLGSVWDQLPLLYNVTDVFCTPSVMEGFGMSAQEAAASGKPVISSNLVPFVCEYLLGTDPGGVACDRPEAPNELLFGEAGVVVPADFVEGFAAALVALLRDDDRRHRMGARAREITVPYFTWRHLTEKLLADLGVSPGGRVAHA
jgi:mannosylfructose-phosphate synthase